MVHVPPPCSGDRPQPASRVVSAPRGLPPSTPFSLGIRGASSTGPKASAAHSTSGLSSGKLEAMGLGSGRPIMGPSASATNHASRPANSGEGRGDGAIEGSRERPAHPTKDDRPAGDRLGSEDANALDPLSRSLWCLAPPEHRVLEQSLAAAPTLMPPPGTPPAALDDILARMVTRFALSGDKRRGTSHLVVGAGELSGGSVTLEAEGKSVHVRIDAPPGVDARAFGESIRARLEAKGLEPTIELR